MILVTGSTGLVGSHLLYQLVSRGEPVAVIVRDTGRLSCIRNVFSYYTHHPVPLLNAVTVKQGDLLDPETVFEALEGITHVYHCAATVSFNPADKEKMTENNIRVTANVVNGCLARGIRKLVHISSTAALGEPEDGDMITEETDWRYKTGITGYSLSKHEAEREVWRGEAEGLDMVVINPSIVIGPGNWGESSTALIQKCYKGLKFYTTGVHGYVDVRDVAEAMIRLMNSNISRERFILSAESISFQTLFDMITTALGKPVPKFRADRWMAEVIWRLEWARSKFSGKAPLITRETARQAMEMNYYSTEKLRKALDFPFRPLSETITWTCAQFLKDHQQAAIH